MASHIFFEGKDREISHNIRLNNGKRLLILAYPGDKALAVSAIQFELSGLFVDMCGHHHIADMDRFMQRLPEYIEAGIYE